MELSRDVLSQDRSLPGRGKGLTHLFSVSDTYFPSASELFHDQSPGPSSSHLKEPLIPLSEVLHTWLLSTISGAILNVNVAAQLCLCIIQKDILCNTWNNFLVPQVESLPVI